MIVLSKRVIVYQISKVMAVKMASSATVIKQACREAGVNFLPLFCYKCNTVCVFTEKLRAYPVHKVQSSQYSIRWVNDRENKVQYFDDRWGLHVALSHVHNGHSHIREQSKLKIWENWWISISVKIGRYIGTLRYGHLVYRPACYDNKFFWSKTFIILLTRPS